MSEKEYIERGEIVRHIRRIYDELSNAYVSPNGGSCAEREKASLNGALTVALVVETAAKAIPAADVVEVRHGEWYDSEYEYLKCSVCGEAVYVGFDVTAEEDLQKQLWTNYCPHCGAKMDGGEA